MDDIATHFVFLSPPWWFPIRRFLIVAQELCRIPNNKRGNAWGCFFLSNLIKVEINVMNAMLCSAMILSAIFAYLLKFVYTLYQDFVRSCTILSIQIQVLYFKFLIVYFTFCSDLGPTTNGLCTRAFLWSDDRHRHLVVCILMSTSKWLDNDDYVIM